MIFGFIQSHIWRNAGFGIIRSPSPQSVRRSAYDPTVIPIDDASQDDLKNDGSCGAKKKEAMRYYTLCRLPCALLVRGADPDRRH